MSDLDSARQGFLPRLLLRGLMGLLGLVFLILPVRELFQFLASETTPRFAVKTITPLPETPRDYADLNVSGKDEVRGIFFDPVGEVFLCDHFERKNGGWKLSASNQTLVEDAWTSPFAPYLLKLSDGTRVLQIEERGRAQVRLLGSNSVILPGSWGEGSDPVAGANGLYLTVISNQRSRIYFYDLSRKDLALVSPQEKRAHYYHSQFWPEGGLVFFTGVSYLDPRQPESGFLHRLFFKRGKDELRAFPVGFSEKMKLRPFKVSGDGSGRYFAHTSEILPMLNAAVFCDLRDYPFPISKGSNDSGLIAPLPKGACLAIFPGLGKLQTLAFNPHLDGEIFLAAGKGQTLRNQIFSASYTVSRVHVFRILRTRLLFLSVLALAGLALVGTALVWGMRKKPG